MTHVKGNPDDEALKRRASSEVSRPTGVVILAMLFGIAAALFTLITIIAATGALGGAAFGMPMLAGAAGAATLVYLVLAVATAAIAYGLWSRKRAAWVAALVLDVAAIAWGVYALFVGDVLDGVVGLLAAGLVLWYLFQPTVRSWFGLRGTTPDRYGRPT